MLYISNYGKTTSEKKADEQSEKKMQRTSQQQNDDNNSRLSLKGLFDFYFVVLFAFAF